MSPQHATACTAFFENQKIASGPIQEVVSKIKSSLTDAQQSSVFVFDDESSHVVEVDFRGTLEESLKRLTGQSNGSTADHLVRTAGRPRLGVVAREVTLLPRHWEWLNDQPGGASVTLRKLVETASKAESSKDKIRRAQETCYRFMSTIAGNQKDFEEAARALFAGSGERFSQCIQSWPEDFREHAEKLAAPAFDSAGK